MRTPIGAWVHHERGPCRHFGTGTWPTIFWRRTETSFVRLAHLPGCNRAFNWNCTNKHTWLVACGFPLDADFSLTYGNFDFLGGTTAKEELAFDFNCGFKLALGAESADSINSIRRVFSFIWLSRISQMTLISRFDVEWGWVAVPWTCGIVVLFHGPKGKQKSF